ncbi:MAG TPA: hypothetical protein VF531_06675 [Bacillota bacterium]
MNLYPKNATPKLTEELFRNPSAEYRGTPFWAWNCRLDKELLLKQIGQLQAMGMGGFHIHSRTGMATPYLGNEFMELVRLCHEEAKRRNMLCWLYDEDRWPSGAAGGLVTKEKRFRSRYLVFMPGEGDSLYCPTKQDFDRMLQNGANPRGYFLAKYGVKLEDGVLVNYQRITDGISSADGMKIYRAYLEISPDKPWHNNQAYVNTLDREAIERFVELTHEQYFRHFGADFGKTIPAIFTDEPQFHHKESFQFATEERTVILPFSDDLPDTYLAEYGMDLLDHLPELFWELPDGKVSVARYRYHEHVAERFTTAFADTVGAWCSSHGIMLTGHMMEEPTLFSQTKALGEAMRSYRSFQLPGIDILCDRREYTTAKQAQSAAHQYGCPGVLSELYGVTNWDFDFRGHKLQGDWQAALGVTVRVHHLTLVSMAGEAKRDYPASIGYQSPWYKEYHLIEDYFSRVNTALTRGVPRVRIGVIHPIESYWLHWGPLEQTFAVRDELENNFRNITEWLLFGLLDFDYLSEALLPSLTPGEVSVPFEAGKMKYDVIIVPGCHTLRSTTVARLEAFQKAGGVVIFSGEPVWLVDAEPSDRVRQLAAKCSVVPFTKRRITEALEPYREVDIRNSDGSRTEDLIYQMRNDGGSRWLFICHARTVEDPWGYKLRDQPSFKPQKIEIRLKGKWRPSIYNGMDGTICLADARVRGNDTVINHEFYSHDSLLLRLEPGEAAIGYSSPLKLELPADPVYMADPPAITLDEPNVLLLDMAEYSFDGGAWQPVEEILRIDTLFRKQLGYKIKTEPMAQPWTDTAVEPPSHTLSLRFRVQSEIEIPFPSLALENPENTLIIVNGKEVQPIVKGWFVDEAIKTVSLPALVKGENEIILNIPFGARTDVEWCYLLGDFGVEVQGRFAKIIKSPRTLAFGDWTEQGLPFYAGNVTYHCPIHSHGGNLIIQVPLFQNTVLGIKLDGKTKGDIAFEPYTLNLGYVEAGEHQLEITAFGNRVNAFGAVHNCIRNFHWYGPNAWRSTGVGWSYQYRLRPMGVLVTPRIFNIIEGC